MSFQNHTMRLGGQDSKIIFNPLFYYYNNQIFVLVYYTLMGAKFCSDVILVYLALFPEETWME